LSNWYDANLADLFPGSQDGATDGPNTDDILALMNQPVGGTMPGGGTEGSEVLLEDIV
jgi:hypothetical protein